MGRKEMERTQTVFLSSIITQKDSSKKVFFLKSMLAKPPAFSQLLPQTVENMAVWENSQHDVLSGGVVDERSLGVHEKHIRHPDLFHQAPVKSHAFVRAAGEGQALVLPVVSEVQGHGKVLRNEKRIRRV